MLGSFPFWHFVGHLYIYNIAKADTNASVQSVVRKLLTNFPLNNIDVNTPVNCLY